MIKKCKYCRVTFESELNLNPYCSNLCRSKDKFSIIKGEDNKEFKIWKKNYEKYPDFYNSLKTYKDRYKNKCFVCGIEFEKFSMCCSIECSSIMKRESTTKTTGSPHNFSRDSISRKNMHISLKEKYGIDNVYQREDVKNKLRDTWIKKYGYTNPSKVDYIKNKKRETAEQNGFWIPKEQMNERRIYEENVYNITWSQIKQYGELKFGKDLWDRFKKSRKLDNKKWITVDHRFSRNQGFLYKVSPEIIGHICNLQLLTFDDNRRKQTECSISLEGLNIEISEFEKKLNFK